MNYTPRPAGLAFNTAYPMTERITTFWSRVDVRGPDECWLWKGKDNFNKKTGKGGYGTYFLNSTRISAHRFAYMISIGPIPNGLCVLHKCDVRRCVNPSHLFSGTLLDNNRDMFRKGRGSNPPRWSTISTPEEVRQIRREYLGFGKSVRKAAQKLNLSFKRVEAAVYGWESIPW
jgi:hypothetical protein